MQTLQYVKIGSIKYMLSLLNSFDENIEFTFETENKSKLTFLNVSLFRNSAELTTERKLAMIFT